MFFDFPNAFLMEKPAGRAKSVRPPPHRAPPTFSGFS